MNNEAKKPDTLPKLFEQRMDREGRIKEYRARVKAVMDDGLMYNQARRQTMKEFGYAGPDAERALNDEYERAKRNAVEREILGEVREETRVRTVEEAIDLVTSTASPACEIEWVRAHPAMSRQARQRDKTKPVNVTADDILYAPHGPAPSRSAVNMLMNWVDRPHDFFKQILAEHRKRVEDGGDSQGSMADPGLGDIQVYLAQIKAMVTHGEEDERRRGDAESCGTG